MHYDVDKYCEQLFISPFSNDIENRKPPIKFNTLKCLDYQRMKDLVTHVLHFIIDMAHISVSQDKRDVMMWKLFVDTLYDDA